MYCASKQEKENQLKIKQLYTQIKISVSYKDPTHISHGVNTEQPDKVEKSKNTGHSYMSHHAQIRTIKAWCDI